MRRTIRELRQARGLTQEDLARQASIPCWKLSRMENLLRGAEGEVLGRLCSVLECRPEDLLLAPARTRGGQLRAAGELLSRFREPPTSAPRPQWTSAARLASLRRDLPQFMRKLETTVTRWREYLEEVPSESRNETILQLQELARGAQAARASTDWLGFQLWPVCDEAGRGASTLVRPALITRDWVMLFQVWMMAGGRRWRLDGLLLVLEPRRTFINLEVDGLGHDPREDERRASALGMATLRIDGKDLMGGPSLTERLQALGYCQPRSGRRS